MCVNFSFVARNTISGLNDSQHYLSVTIITIIENKFYKSFNSDKIFLVGT